MRWLVIGKWQEYRIVPEYLRIDEMNSNSDWKKLSKVAIWQCFGEFTTALVVKRTFWIRFKEYGAYGKNFHTWPILKQYSSFKYEEFIPFQYINGRSEHSRKGLVCS